MPPPHLFITSNGAIDILSSVSKASTRAAGHGLDGSCPQLRPWWDIVADPEFGVSNYPRIMHNGISYVDQSLYHRMHSIDPDYAEDRAHLVFAPEIASLLHACKESRRIALEEWRGLLLRKAALPVSVQSLEVWWAAGGRDIYQLHLLTFRCAALQKRARGSEPDHQQ